MSIVPGAVYYERGRPVTIVCRWGREATKRNVWIRRADGTDVVRPFRGLRKTNPNEE